MTLGLWSLPWLSEAQRHMLEQARKDIDAAHEKLSRVNKSEKGRVLLYSWAIDNAERYYAAVLRQLLREAPLKYRVLYRLERIMGWLERR